MGALIKSVLGGDRLALDTKDASLEWGLRHLSFFSSLFTRGDWLFIGCDSRQTVLNFDIVCHLSSSSILLTITDRFLS